MVYVFRLLAVVELPGCGASDTYELFTGLINDDHKFIIATFTCKRLFSLALSFFSLLHTPPNYFRLCGLFVRPSAGYSAGLVFFVGSLE